jgi:SLT domain-containing protein
MTEQIARGFIDVDVRQSDALTEIKRIVREAKAEVESLSRVEGTAKLGAGQENLDRALVAAKAKLASFSRENVELAIRVKEEALDRDLKSVALKIKKAQIDKANKLVVNADADTAKLDKKLAELDLEKKRFEEKKLKIGVDASELRNAVTEIERVGKAEDKLAKERDKRAADDLKRYKQDEAAAYRIQKGLEDRYKLEERNAYRENAQRDVEEKNDLKRQDRETQFRLRREEDAKKRTNLRTLEDLEIARQAVHVSDLAKAYKDLGNKIEESDFKKGGIGSKSEKNIERGVDVENLELRRKAIVEELKSLGAHETIFRIKATDQGSFERLKQKLSNFLGDAFGKIGAFSKLNVNLGPISGSIGGIATAIAGALPLITDLLGSLTSLVGVAGSGALGAGAIGGGILSGLVTNLFGVRDAVKHVSTEYGEASKAQEHYEQTVNKFGAGSKKAEQAHAQLLEILKNINPATAKAAVGVRELDKEWLNLVLPKARADIGRSLSAGIETVKGLLPGLAKNSDETLGIISQHIDSIFAHLRQPAESKAFLELGKDANKFLGPALGGVERFGSGILHVFESASRIFAGPLGKAIFNIGKSFNEATQPGKELDERVEKLGHDAEAVIKFFKALGKVLLDVLGAATPAGREFTASMTGGLEKWDEFLKSTRGKNDSAKFFHEAVKGTEALWGIVAPLTKLLFTWSAGLTPFVNEVLKIAQAFTEGFIAVGKLVGFNKPLAALGEALAVAFAVSKVTAFTGAVSKAVGAVKELGALGTIGKILTGSGGGLGNSVAAGGKSAAVTMGTSIRESGLIVAEEWRAAMTGAPSTISAASKGAPTVLSTAEKDAAQGSGGLIGLLKTTLVKAGLVGLASAGATELTASLVGGKTGKDIQSVGLPASVGAALGFAAGGPIGAAVGGAVVGSAAYFAKGIFKATQAENAAHSTAKGTEAPVAKGLESGIEKANQEFSKELYKIEHTKKPDFSEKFSHFLNKITGGIATDATEKEPESPRTRREKKEAKDKQEASLFSAGKQFGGEHFKEETKVLSGFSGAGKVTGLITDLEKRLVGLPPAAQKGMFEAILALVKTAEKNKELPAHSFDEITKTIESKFPGLARAFSTAGQNSVGALNAALKGQNTLTGIEALVNNWRNVFPKLPEIVGLNMGNAVSTFQGLNKKLEELAHTGPESMRSAYKELLGKLRDEQIKFFHEGRAGVEGELKKLEAAMKKGATGITQPLESAFNNLVGIIKKEMALAGGETKKGAKQINDLLKQELKVLGAPTDATLEASAESAQGEKRNKYERATGGLVQYGRGGASGTDTIPVQMLVGSGEQGAVFTKQQQAVANEYLAPIGGLPGLFNKYSAPHYMAHGGFTPGDAYPGPQGRTDQGVDYAGPGPVKAVADGTVRSVGLWPGWPGIGGIVYDTAKGLVYVMEDFVASVKRGAKLVAGQVIGQDTGGQFGIETGWANSAGTGPEVPYNGLADGTATAGGIAFRNFIGTGAGSGVGGGAEWRNLHEPKVHQKGLIGAIAQAVVHKATSAANRKGRAEAAPANRGRGANHEASGAQGGKAAGTAQMRTWAADGLRAAGLEPSAANISTIVYTMTRESGGNPRSENRTDSNAAAGHPSRGLMELIPENFQKYHVGGTSNNVFDPVANVAASVRYMIARYGHIVGMSPYAKGGLVGGSYNKPALLVGEHENEYVINPRRPDNAAYLKEAGEDMGYNVTAASSGKGKPKPKKAPAKGSTSDAASNFHDLNLPRDFESGGVPESLIVKLVADLESEFGKDKNKLASLRTRGDKEKEAVKAAQHAAGLSHDKNLYAANESIAKAKHSSGVSLAAAKLALQNAQNKPINHKNAAEGGSASAEASKGAAVSAAQKKLASAEKQSSYKIAQAEKAAAHKLKVAKDTAAEKLFAAQKKLKDTEHGIKLIDSNAGGEYENIKWPGYKKVKKDMETARHDRNRVQAFNQKIAGLNTIIGDDQAKLANISKRYAHDKAIGNVAGMNAENAKWNAVLHDRSTQIKALRGFLGTASKVASEMGRIAKGDEATKAFAALGNTLAKEETTAESAADETAEQEEIGAPEKNEIQPPSSEEFVKQRGKLAALQAYEKEYALSQTKLVPDNPNTPQNEELPGLKEQLGPASKLSGFWEELLKEGQSIPEPDVTIKELAGQVTGARGTYLGLKSQIEGDERSQGQANLADVVAFSSAREELFKNFGSNFAPVWAQPAPAVPATLGVGGAGTNPVAQQPAAGKTVTINNTNHFSQPPANPHHWSAGVAWELQAAI